MSYELFVVLLGAIVALAILVVGILVILCIVAKEADEKDISRGIEDGRKDTGRKG